MGKVYYDMGFLQSAEVIEASATDLVGRFVGETGPKTRGLLEKALGKILLVDEAYRLGEGQFAKEAIDEVVDCITKPKFKQKLIIILAGYDNDINRLMAINPGLTSRFPESVPFNGLSPDACINLLTRLILSRKHKLSQRLATVNMIAFEQANATLHKEMKTRFSTLSRISNWANARDVETLAQAIFRRALKSMDHDSLVVNESNALEEMDQMIDERMKREMPFSSDRNPAFPGTDLALDTQSSHAHTTNSKFDTGSYKKPPLANEEEQEDIPHPIETTDTRDPGVSDTLWDQLQKDKAREESRERQYQKLVQSEDCARKAVEDARDREKTIQQMSDQEKDDDESKKRHEHERLKHELERRSYEERLARLQKKQEEEQKRRQQEQQAQEKLRHMGVCCAGFRWIKQGSGYRCAGGSHYVSNEQLGL